MKPPIVIDLARVRSEKLTPEQYMDVVSKRPGLVERARFTPPKLGDKNFGSFEVRNTRALHRALKYG